MRQLLNARVAVDPRDSASATPLALAAAAGSVPCLRALLAYGASTGATDSAGQTARQLAAAAGHRAAELYLLAVESTAAAFPGRPTRVDLLAGEDQELDAIFRKACTAQGEVSLGGFLLHAGSAHMPPWAMVQGGGRGDFHRPLPAMHAVALPRPGPACRLLPAACRP